MILLARTTCLVFLSFDTAQAWPSSYAGSCDTTCLAGKRAGDAFNHMGVTSFGTPTGANCMITTNIPSDGYVAGTTYKITVTSVLSLAMILDSTVAGFSGSAKRKTQGSKTTSYQEDWTAT